MLALAACGGNASVEQPSVQAVANAGSAGLAEVPVAEVAACADVPAVVGCGCPQEPTPPPEVWSCIACADLPATSALIGPEGGSLTLRGPGVAWFKLTIPPNALQTPTKIQISPSVRAPVSLAPASDGYAIEPQAVVFALPVSVTVPLAAKRAGAGLYWSPDVCSEPVWAADSVVTSDTVSGTITHGGVVFASSAAASNQG